MHWTCAFVLYKYYAIKSSQQFYEAGKSLSFTDEDLEAQENKERIHVSWLNTMILLF